MSLDRQIVSDLEAERRRRFEVVWDDRKPSKPVLPALPSHDDVVGQCTWMTAVLHLDQGHPITGGVQHGAPGGAGHVELARFEAEALHFEPASKLSNAQRLAEELVWQLLPIDDEPYPWSNPQAVKIARVVRLLCGTARRWGAEQEAMLVVTTLIEASQEINGHTESSAERYEAVVNLRPVEDANGRPGKGRYLIDGDRSELVIRVSDLLSVARRIEGSLPHGWLDARMEAIGWRRWTLQGYGLWNGSGRGPHKRCDVYSGTLPLDPDDPDDEQAVNT